MTDTEKIIKGIKICGNGKPSCKGCPYYEFKSPMCLYTLHKEAADLIRRQQAEGEKQIPKKANISIKLTTDYNTAAHCPTCHKMLTGFKPHYCSECGQAIDWSEEF